MKKGLDYCEDEPPGGLEYAPNVGEPATRHARHRERRRGRAYETIGIGGRLSTNREAAGDACDVADGVQSIRGTMGSLLFIEMHVKTISDSPVTCKA